MLHAVWRWTKDIEMQIVDEIEDLYPVIHVCSGISGLGDYRLDSQIPVVYDLARKDKKTLPPNMKGDMGWLPFKDGIADAVISDPPYSMKRYGKEYPKFVSELARITKPGGKIIFLCPWVLQHKTLTPLRFWLRPSGETAAMFSYKILSVSVKTNGQIGDYVNYASDA